MLLTHRPRMGSRTQEAALEEAICWCWPGASFGFTAEGSQELLGSPGKSGQIWPFVRYKQVVINGVMQSINGVISAYNW